MNIAALETTTPAGSVALKAGGKIRDREVDLRGEGAVAGLFALLAESGVSPADLDAVAVSTGPGSFTGIRIGIAAAQGLALARGIPVVPVGTLEGIAESASEGALPGTLILPSVDARRGEVYAALYRAADAGDAPVLAWGPEAVSPVALLALLGATSSAATPGGILCGDGTPLLRPLFGAESGWVAPPELARTRAAAVLRAAIRKAKSGEMADSASVEPVYLRKTDAEIRREQRKETESGSTEVP